MEITIAQCVEVFFTVFKKDQNPWDFVLDLETHQHEWLGTPQSKPVSVDDSLAKDGIPRAKC